MKLVITFMAGLILGSFLHAWIFRHMKAQSIIKGRSLCLECNTQLIWYDLVPVLSWLFLKARCRYCNQKIPWHYPAAELGTAVVFVLLYLFVYH